MKETFTQEMGISHLFDIFLGVKNISNDVTTIQFKVKTTRPLGNYPKQAFEQSTLSCTYLFFAPNNT